LGKAMGYSVVAADPDAEPALFPQADRIFNEPAAPELAALGGGAAEARGGAGGSRRGCYAVVATMGERDEEAIRAALALRPAYLGVVASAKRFAQVRQSLLARGIAAAALDSIRSPAGVAIGAQAPEEIAVSVLAEIVARRHAAEPEVGEEPAAGEELAAGEEPAAGQESAGEQSPAEPSRGLERASGAVAARAVDPVCGMAVEIAGARHVAEAGGRSWYFCCGGCRERFLAAPERFMAAREPGGARPRRATEGAA
ncbi:MAG: XdhC family protein, partial [Acidobacteria bacterium]|nr:XdhC family protein [Acidobacteriota bacterium]